MPKKKYDSKFERRLHQGVLKSFTHHSQAIKYTWPAETKRYNPDFRKGNLVIESKGRFRPGEQKKYLFIKPECDKLGLRFVFLFMNPECPMPGARKRKDGTKLTMREWADKKGIEWYTEQTIKDIL